MKIFYDKHDKNYEEYLKDDEKSKIADSWLDINSLDYWRHDRMLNLIKPFIEKDEAWLTIGDGRYGSESSWLKIKGINCHASDMHTSLLKIAYEKSLIDSFSKQNAEKLEFDDDTFDYVLIKETLHHLPRPWLQFMKDIEFAKKE